MAKLEERLRYIIEAIWKGDGATAAASRGIDDVGKSAQRTDGMLKQLGSGWSSLATPVNQTLEIINKVGQAFKDAWAFLEEGAALNRTAEIFDNLSASIGTTADVLLSEMGEASSGMMSNAEMMASASDIIRLGLADTQDGVVRLSNLVARSGWDMQQVIMTFANDSKMRLDALGLSVTDVEARIKKYTDAGMDASKAFDLAVIEAGEAKLLLLGDAAESLSGKMKILTTDTNDFKDAFQATFSELALTDVFGLLDLLGYEGADGQAAGEQMAQDVYRGLLAGFAGLALPGLGILSLIPGLNLGAEFGERATGRGNSFIENFLGLNQGRNDLAAELRRQVRENLEAMEDEASSADAVMLGLADRMEAVRKSAAVVGSGWSLDAMFEGLERADRIVATLDAIERVNAAMREGVRLRDEAARAATTARRQELGGTFVQEFDFDTLQRQFGDYYQFVLDKSKRIAALKKQIAEIRPDEEGKFTEAESKQLADLEKRLAANLELQGQIATGFIPDEEMAMGAQSMIEAAAAAGAWSKNLYELAGSTEAAGEALRAAAIESHAQKLGEVVAAGLMLPAEAMQNLQDFIDGLSLEDVFRLDDARVGSREVAETAKQEMLRVVEGIEPAVAETVSPALEAVSAVDEALKQLDEVTATPEIQDNAADAQENLTEYRRYWDANIAGLSTTHTINIQYVTEGMPPGAPPPGRAMGGPVMPGSPYVVGEKGPELFIPKAAGDIVPASAGGAGAWGMSAPAVVVQNFNGLGVGGAVAVARRTLANYTRGMR